MAEHTASCRSHRWRGNFTASPHYAPKACKWYVDLRFVIHLAHTPEWKKLPRIGKKIPWENISYKTTTTKKAYLKMGDLRHKSTRKVPK